MTVVYVQPCACCKLLVEAERMVFDPELIAQVCTDCELHLSWAKTVMAQDYDKAGRRIAIREIYRGQDAPDNQTAHPPHAEH